MFKLPKGVIYIVETLQKSGFKAYVVGGSIRDLLIGIPVYDWDITTDAIPDLVSSLFKKVIPTGVEYGTVTVMLDDGAYEVTTFRSDENYSDGRRPDKVSFTKDIRDDLSRRDFTMNAIAYDPLSKELIDPFNGRADIKAKLVRAVGDPEKRLGEDGLRSLRACRFAAKLGFEIEEKALSAISKTLDVFGKVAPERVHDEIMKMMMADKPSVGFEYMRKTGLLKLIMPELEAGLGVEQPKPFHVHDVYYHNIYACDSAPKELPLVRLAALLHDISKPECKKDGTFYDHDIQGSDSAEAILKRLKFSNDDIEDVANLVRNHMFNYTPEWSDSAVRRFIKRVGIDNLEDLFLLRIADMKAMEKEINSSYLKDLKDRIKWVIEAEDALDVSDLKINGKQVMQVLGCGPGPKIGEVLNGLLEKVLDDPSLNEKDRLIEMVKQYK